ncbi:MAG: glycosyltransferase [Chloroflexota bacterium]
MNVGLVTDFYYPWIAGPSILIRNLGHGLLARGHYVSLLAPSPSGRAFIESDGAMDIKRVHTARSPVGHELRFAPWPWRQAGDWLDRVRPDVVHIHHPFPLSIATLLLARRRGIPVAATNHTIPACSLYGMREMSVLYPLAHAITARWLIAVLNRCTLVATPTQTAAGLLHDLGFRKPVRVISNGVDTNRFRPGPPDPALRTRLGLDERPIVLYTGRLDAEKDMDTWLRAATIVRRSHDVQFVVGGTGSERARLEHLAAELQLEGAVRFMGYLSDDEFPSIYRLATLYLITSPVELQSISTLEAVSSGLPVVAVAAGALPELVREGMNGYCAAVGDAHALAAAVVSILANAATAPAIESVSRSLGLTHDLEESIRQYESFLVETLATEGGMQRRERSGFVWG